MGTRSLTVIRDESDREICVLYRQFDGYPTGHGEELKDFLTPFTVVNGLPVGGSKQSVANGMGCLAAQLIAHFKTEAGNFYLEPAGTRDCGEEWIYTVCEREGRIWLTVQGGVVTYFGLPGTKQAHMPTLYQGTVDEFDPSTIERLYTEVLQQIPNDYLAAIPDTPKPRRRRRVRATA